MTENQNSNADGEQPTPTPGNGQDSDTSSPGAAGPATNGADTPQSHDMNDLDAAWAAFEAEHQADLHDVASSRQAKKFEKQAKKREKEALLSVDDLDIGSFTDDARGGKKGKQSGPRDFTGSSWLDTDNVMDAYDDGGFTPPNPDLGPVKASTVLLTALLIIGLAGETVMIFVPGLNAIPLLGALLNILFGLGVILGLGGLVAKILNRKDRPGDQGGYYDDGARV